MDDKIFDLFCPKCNILVETKVIAEGSGRFESTNPLNDIDAPYNMDMFFLSLCPRCNQPFLVKQSLYGVPAEFETVADEVVLYPDRSRIPVENLPLAIRTAYEQAIRSFDVALYEPCVLMCRKALEVVCKSLGATGKNLYQRIEKLKVLRYIDQRLLDWSHEIRSIGNDAAHDIDAEITVDDARDILDLTEAILLYVFSLNSRFDEYKKRQEKKANQRA